MDTKYNQITNIITRLAAENPYITKDQIARAKSMYNGDARPIEEIEAELTAYSTQIAEAARQSVIEKPEISEHTNNDIVIENDSIEQVAEPEVISTPNLTFPEDIESYHSGALGNEKKEELREMIDNALNNEANNQTYNNESANTASYNQEKVYVKTPMETTTPQNNGLSDNDGGYGSATALLALTIICSIITIVVSVFTIVAN